MTKPSPPRLGRGLSALFGELSDDRSDKAAPSSIAVGAIKPGPFQPRSSIVPDSLEELTHSIQQHGVLQPILVRPHRETAGHYEIIAGERRWRAAQAAGLHAIPVLIRDLTDSEATTAALVENLQRQDLDPIEEAEGYAKLGQSLQLQNNELAAMVGKSRSHVANTLRLLQLTPEVSAFVRDGQLTAGHARALLNHHDQAGAARHVISAGLNVRQTEALTRTPEPKLEPRQEPATEFQTVAQQLTDHLGLKASIEPKAGGGVLSIRFKNTDQLEGLIKLLMPNF